MGLIWDSTRVQAVGSGVLILASIVFLSRALAQSPTPGLPAIASPTPVTLISPVNPFDTTKPLTLVEAIDKAFAQASLYKNAQLDELIRSEDVKQSRIAFLPKITAPLDTIYTSPSFMRTSPRPPSFLGANAITEYQALLNAAGEIDTSGKLAATLQRNQALVESARAGTEVARRELIQAVVDAYYNLALATTKRRGAQGNLSAAEQFESVTALNVKAGEVAPIDLTRSRLQTAARRDELEQANVDELTNADVLRFLVGEAFTEPIATIDLLTELPVDDEIQRYSEATIQTRPEFAQFAADKRAAEKEISIARSERRPQITYSVSSGFITDSFRPVPLKNQTGLQATIGFSIPIFDWGASHSRETQAHLKVQQNDIARTLAERQFTQAFFIARAEALSARERITQLRSSIVDAESNVNTSISRYRSGEGPISEVVDAQNTLITQRQALYKAIFDYQKAKSRLARAVGQ
jgi:outer membrane protein TolC